MTHIFEMNLTEHVCEDLFQTAPALPSICIGCLSKSGPYIKLINCKHNAFFERFFQDEIDYLEALVCLQCHCLLKKLDLFRQQVKESLNVLNNQPRQMTATTKFQNIQQTPIEMISVSPIDMKTSVISAIHRPLHLKQPIQQHFNLESINRQTNIAPIPDDHNYIKPIFVRVKSETTNQAECETTRDIKIEIESCSDTDNIDEPIIELKGDTSIQKIPEYIMVPALDQRYKVEPTKEIAFKPVPEGQRSAKYIKVPALKQRFKIVPTKEIELKPVPERYKAGPTKEIAFKPVPERHKSAKYIEVPALNQKFKVEPTEEHAFKPVPERYKAEQTKEIAFKPVPERHKSATYIEVPALDQCYEAEPTEVIAFKPLPERYKAEQTKEISNKPVPERYKEEQLKDINIIELKPVHQSFKQAKPTAKVYMPPHPRYEGIVKKVTLTKEELMLERDKEKLGEKYLKHPYKCETCIKVFDHKIHLKNHMIKRHTAKPGANVCEICQSVFMPHACKLHIQRHLTRYDCLACGKRYNSLFGATTHCAQVHGNVQPADSYQCEECDFTTQFYTQYYAHKVKHRPRVRCQQCDKMVISTYYKTHLLTAHRSTVDDGDNDPGTAYCAPCDAHFSTQKGLANHLKRHSKHRDDSAKRFECDYCGKRYPLKCSLLDHINGMHLKRYSYSCNQCDEKFLRESYLRRHQIATHVEGGAPRDKICQYCGKGFTMNRILEAHIRTHTGERPLQCARCPATFAHSAARYTHNKLVHLRKRPVK